MHLSTSSVPLDPSLLAGFAPGASSGPQSAAAADAGTAPSAEFGDLFAELAPADPAAANGATTGVAVNGNAGVGVGIFAARFTRSGLGGGVAVPPGLVRGLSLLARGPGLPSSLDNVPEVNATASDETFAVGTIEEGAADARDAKFEERGADDLATALLPTPDVTTTTAPTPTLGLTVAASLGGSDDPSEATSVTNSSDDATSASEKNPRDPASGLPLVALERRATDRMPAGLLRRNSEGFSGAGVGADRASTRAFGSEGNDNTSGSVRSWREIGHSVISDAGFGSTDVIAAANTAIPVAGENKADGVNISWDDAVATFSAEDTRVLADDSVFDASSDTRLDEIPSEATSANSSSSSDVSTNPDVSGDEELKSSSDLSQPALSDDAITTDLTDAVATALGGKLPQPAAPALAHASVNARFHREATNEQSGTRGDEAQDASADMSGTPSATVSDVTMRIAASPRSAGDRGPWAKISDSASRAPEKGAEVNRLPKKTFLSAVEEEDTNASPGAGTGIAKSGAVMSLRASNPELPSSLRLDAVATVVDNAGSLTSAPSAEATSANSPLNSAHEAVAVVLRAVEEMSTRERSAVNLQFSVGDADLAVRVELHANEVRATFRTDSPELRAALNSEWQSAASSQGDRSVRIVPAVFSASDNAAFNAFSGDASSRQRSQGEHHQNGQSQTPAWSSRLGAVARPAANIAAPIAVARSAAPNSRRLHTVA